ncbi:MAG TPA: hypothetical protein VNU97_11300 [Rhizomicrobium sp.]|jgi:hypothetical protein|nr:hypothetical protein [Rhizomicrobium sp.]
MASMVPETGRMASCDCGKVRFKAMGKPIVSAVCYCTDCQAGGRQIEAAGARRDFRDAWQGTGYLTYRDDRLECLAGASLLRGFKLREGSGTTRFMTTCCKSAIYLKFAPGRWTSMYRVRFGDAAPPLEMRNNVQHAQDPATLPDDVPAYRGFPLKLLWRLLRASIGSWLRI